MFCFLVVVQFEKSEYWIFEDKGPLQPVLVLSKPAPTDIIVQVVDNYGTATGE